MNKSYFERDYHFYMDEGGIFGDCKVLITDKPIPVSDSAGHISNYNFGKCPYNSIIRHIQLFRIAFPLYNTVITTDSKYISPVIVTESVMESVGIG